jgi:hypothetical protein
MQYFINTSIASTVSPVQTGKFSLTSSICPCVRKRRLVPKLIVPAFWIRKISKVYKNTRSPLLRFRSALHCGYSGITDKDSGLE